MASEVSELAPLIRSPRFSCLSAAWWKSSPPPRRVRLRRAGRHGLAALEKAWQQACMASGASPLPPLVPLGSAPVSPGGTPCCHPGWVMSPDAPLGLGCSSSGFVFGVAVDGEERLLPAVPRLAPHPPAAEGSWGELGQAGGARSGGGAELGGGRLGVSPLCGWGGDTGTSSRLMWEVQGPGKSAGTAPPPR